MFRIIHDHENPNNYPKLIIEFPDGTTGEYELRPTDAVKEDETNA